MPSAFISHSSPDDRYVEEFVQLVRSLGFDDVFKDSHTIEPDALFWERIEQGIRDCDAFVVVLSHASVQSYWVDREVQFARSQGKKVIPVRIDDCKPPASFDGRDVIELRHGRGDKVKLAPSRITKHSPAILFGRDNWLDALDAAWAKPHLNVYVLVAWGGVGKTSLVAHWVSQRMEAKGWPGVERYFDWSFYSQGTGESRQTSSDLFIQEALKFFDDPDPIAGSPWERGERLARLIQQHRTLLVLDGIEPLQYPVNDPQAGRLKDQALEALLQGLAADNPGLCIVTTREHLKNIESKATTEEQRLDKLVKDAAIDLLRHLQVVGTEEEMSAAWRDAGGHALTLQLLGRFIADAYSDRDVRHYPLLSTVVRAEQSNIDVRSVGFCRHLEWRTNETIEVRDNFSVAHGPPEIPHNLSERLPPLLYALACNAGGRGNDRAIELIIELIRSERTGGIDLDPWNLIGIIAGAGRRMTTRGPAILNPGDK